MPVRILVIEDNAANLELMTYLLRAYRYETLAATDGEAGLRLARLEHPQAIICDIQMPRMDGFEVVRALKSDPATRAIPVVAVTAFAMVGDKERVLAAGFDGYIGKPIVPETFVPQIEQFLARKSGARPMPNQEVPEPPPRKPAVAAGAKILAVDNTPANLELLLSLLRPLGYEVRTVTNVAEALAAARAQVPDLIISDVHMPGQNGFDLLLQAKADPVLREIPVMLASATSWNDDAGRRAASLGADLLLMRPVDPQRILEKVQQLLAAKRD
ncbi:MAG TPA: response regulator [Burkholderiales bacterium]